MNKFHFVILYTNSNNDEEPQGVLKVIWHTKHVAYTLLSLIFVSFIIKQALIRCFLTSYVIIYIFHSS